jgi:hypothetical protein
MAKKKNNGLANIETVRHKDERKNIPTEEPRNFVADEENRPVGKPVFLVSQEDLELLEMLEDGYWAKEGRKALEEFKRAGGKPIPWEQVKARLGL